MSTATQNYHLIKPDLEDYFDISVQNANMDKLDTTLAGLSSGLLSFQMSVGKALNNSNISFKILTQEQYDAIAEHNATTLFFVTKSGKVTQYLGDIKMLSGADTQGIIAGLLSGTNATISGNITTISQMNETEE